MRNLVPGVGAAAIWMLSLGCGFAVVRAASNDAGEVSKGSWSPGQGQTAAVDSGLSPSASLSGQVTLLGAASNVGAQVTIVDPGMKPLQSITDSNGSYFFDALPAGNFSASFSAPGYQTQSRQAVLAAGDSAEISVTLERSLLLSAFETLPDAGVFLGYAQWLSLSDGGREPGEQLFYLDPSGLAWLTLGGDAGAAVEELISSDGGLRFVGFDLEGGAVVEEIDAAGAVGIDFVDEGTRSEVFPGAGVASIVPMGDRVFFGTPSGNEQDDWSCWGRGDLGPTPLAQTVGVRAPPISLTNGRMAGQMAGWLVGDAGFDTPVRFAPEFSWPIDQVCTGEMTPLEPSLDHDRFAFGVLPRTGRISLETGAQAAGPCTESATFEVFIVDEGVVEAEDETFESIVPTVYPLSSTAYAGQFANPDGSQHLFVHEASAGTWKADWEGDVDGWAPLHGSSLLAAERVDGGVELVVIGGEQGSTAKIAASAAIPFAHEWSAAVFVTPDNRYAVFGGIASLFDFEKQTETPLIMTPVHAWFDRSETTALLIDANGQMAAVPLGAQSRGTPQGTALEGLALAASFTPNEDAVAYLGTDPTGAVGLFVQPIP